MKLFKSVFLILFLVQAHGQTSELTLLKGKITSQIKELHNINVLNIRSESSTVTDVSGNYSMFVKVGDTLQFSSLQILTKKVVIEKTDITKKLYVTNVEAKVIPLEEVEIKTYPNINAVSLGILQKPAKVYTPAERKLRTATGFYPSASVGADMMAGGSLSLDPIINAISGRTALLKKELNIEKKEFLLKKIENMFTEEYFLENLKIPKDYLRGFWYYAIEDSKLEEALNEKKKLTARFIFSDLAVKYLEILKE